MAKPVQPVQTPSFTPKYAGWTKAQATTEAVNQLMVQKFKEIVAAYETRKQAKSINDLAKGPWYSNDYKAALDKHKQDKRLKFLVEKNSFHHGFPPKGFDQEKDPNSKTGFAIGSYQIQKEVLPTKALENIKDGQFSFFDCGQIDELAMYETLREVMGDIDFNKTFSGSGPNPLSFDPKLITTPLWKLGFLKDITIQNSSELKFGDHVHFSNIRVYNNKHPYGEAGGFNTILISANDAAEKKYDSFGLPVDGKTEEQMTAVLVEELNEPPIDLSTILCGEMLKHVKQGVQQQVDFFAARDIDLLNLQMTVEEFNANRKISIDQKQYNELGELIAMGLYPIIRRLDIKAIHKHLAN